MYTLTEEELRVRLGKKLKILRLRHGATQVDLATAIGLSSTGAISQVENGANGLKILSLIKAARFLEVSPVDLIVPDDLNEDEIRLRAGLERLLRRKRNDPQSVVNQIAALNKLLLY